MKREYVLKMLLFISILISPYVILSASTYIMFKPWFIKFEYDNKRLPPDLWGMKDSLREHFALIGLKAVTQKDGIKDFENATFKGGIKAFDEKEIKHMIAVYNFLRSMFLINKAFVLILFSSFFIFFKYKRDYIYKTLIFGGIFSFLVFSVLGVLSYYNYDFMFVHFHELFFGKNSWRFSFTSTLIRVYPLKFWEDATLFLAIFIFFFSFLYLIFGLLLKKYIKG